MNTKIAETIRSDSGFFFGDVKMIGCTATKKKAHDVANSGGGKVTDKKTGLDLAVVKVPSSHLRGPYSDNNGDQYSIPTGTLALIPLELVGSQPISTMTGRRVIFGCGDAQLEADGDLVKITLPSAEVVKLHTRRTA